MPATSTFSTGGYSSLCCACCTTGNGDGDEGEIHEFYPASIKQTTSGKTIGSYYHTTQAQKRRLKMADLLEALKKGGGVVNGAKSDNNRTFLDMLDSHLPELKIYCTGKIQTSPGVEEIEGSPTEYYRTVGAIIALLSCYATAHGDDFGIECVSAGERGPMSMEKVPGKFINIGSKPEQYTAFCKAFAETMATEEDWYGMLVFLAVHDVGKSDAFRNAVNATLPVAKRSDDHDRCLARALCDFDLMHQYLPSVLNLSPKRQDMLREGFLTNFQLPQLGQGEIAVINLRGLLALPKQSLNDGTLSNYMYHSIFDIAGAGCNENFIYPLALIPVYMGFSTAMRDLMEKLKQVKKPDEKDLYFDFLYDGFKKAYPEFDEKVFVPLCESNIFKHETGICVLRILALTRNTYKNPQNVLDLLQRRVFPKLIQELSGNPNPPGPQIMLYYAPDMLRMGLGEDMVDESGENMEQALGAFDDIYTLAREALKSIDSGDYQYQLNVQPAVSAIKNAGKSWGGGKDLKNLCNGVKVISNETKTEGIVLLGSSEKDII